MKITIDTASDSHEHIRHVIGLLQRVVGEVSQVQAAISSVDTNSGNPFAGIFGDSTPAQPPQNAQTGGLQGTSAQPAPPSEQQPQVIDLWGRQKKDDSSGNQQVELY